MLHIPSNGPCRFETNVSGTGSELGTSVAAGGVAHTKNATYTQLIAATGYNAFGITIALADTAAASARSNVLVDIAIGGAGSEQVIIPNLIGGNASLWSTASHGPKMYFFPIFIPAGVRLSATAQAAIASDTVRVAVWLHQFPTGPDGFIGQRVTAYGIVSGQSSGTSHSPGNGSYAAATELVASCANPLKYMQMGFDLYDDTTGTTSRGLIRVGIGATPDYIVSELPYCESTSLESSINAYANMILSRMKFAIPSGTRLTVSAMRNVAAEARGWVIYGVD